MRSATQHFARGLALTMFFLLCTGLTTPVRAQPLTFDTIETLRASDAAVVLHKGDVWDGRGQTMRCGPMQRVGLWLEAGSEVSHVHIENCPIGLFRPASNEGATAPVTRMEHITITGNSETTLVCMWDAGTSGSMTLGDISGCQYGVVLVGYFNLYELNKIHDNTKEGVLLLGYVNTLKSNEVMRNAKVGIDAIRLVPQISTGQYLTNLPIPAEGNIIQYNTAQQNGVDLRQWPTPSSCTDLINTWEGNTATKRSPSCLP
jgi:hypothetical protein